MSRLELSLGWAGCDTDTKVMLDEVAEGTRVGPVIR